MVTTLESWVEKTRNYPPLEIFAGTTGKQKAEKRVVDICEDLYRFNWKGEEVNVISVMWAAYREIEVLSKFGMKDINENYAYDAYREFCRSAHAARKAMNLMYKKDQLLQKYYADWSVSEEDLIALTHRWLLRNMTFGSSFKS